jgi:large subunit ribosomal protein L21
VFAIIQSGGRQVKVTPGAVIEVDRVDAEPGTEVSIDRVLFLEKDGGEVLAGAPFVPNVKVVGVVDGESRGPKIRVFKKKRRKLPAERRNRHDLVRRDPVFLNPALHRLVVADN